MSAAQFLESLFGALPEFFKDEDELCAIWSAPDTRKALLRGLAEKGFGRDARKDLGDPEKIRGVFLGFQKYLYQDLTQ